MRTRSIATSLGRRASIGAVCVGLLLAVGVSTSMASTRTSAGATKASVPAKVVTYHAGANLCLSGNSASFGQLMLNGLQLAVSNLNADPSKVLPLTAAQKKIAKSMRLSIDFGDSANDPTQGVTVFNYLVQQRLDPLIYSCGTGVTLATIPLAARAGVLMLNTSAGGSNLVGASPWLYNDFLNSDQEVGALTQYMYATLHLRHVAVNYENDAFGTEALAVFQTDWKKLGGTITASVSHDVGAPDENTQVAQIKAVSQNTDSILILAVGRDDGVFIKEARAAGLTQPFFSTSGIVTPAVTSVAGSAAEGTTFTNIAYNTNAKDLTTREFTQSFAAKYGASTQPSPYTISYYEGVLIWYQAVQYVIAHHMKYTGADLRTALAKQKVFYGVGAKVTFGANQLATKTIALGTIKNGQFTTFKIVGG